MAHVRTQIRQAIVTAVTGLPITGARVYVQRSRRMGQGEAPGLSVSMTEAEVIEDRGTMGRTLELDLTVEIMAFAYGVDEALIETQLDDIAADVEIAIAADTELGGVCEDIAPTAVVYQFENEQDKISGSLTMTYAAKYRHAYGQPETPEA